MALTLEAFEIDRLSSMIDPGDRQFLSARIVLSFTDDQLNYHPTVVINAATYCDYEMPLSHIRAALFKAAAAALAEAARLVEQHDLPQLQRLSDELQARRVAALALPSSE